MSMWLFVILCINVKACPHERSLIAGQTVLPDDNRSFDDVRSVNSSGSYLVALFVTRQLPLLFTLPTSSNDPLSSGNIACPAISDRSCGHAFSLCACLRVLRCSMLICCFINFVL